MPKFKKPWENQKKQKKTIKTIFQDSCKSKNPKIQKTSRKPKKNIFQKSGEGQQARVLEYFFLWFFGFFEAFWIFAFLLLQESWSIVFFCFFCFFWFSRGFLNFGIFTFAGVLESCFFCCFCFFLVFSRFFEFWHFYFCRSPGFFVFCFVCTTCAWEHVTCKLMCIFQIKRFLVEILEPALVPDSLDDGFTCTLAFPLARLIAWGDWWNRMRAAPFRFSPWWLCKHGWVSSEDANRNLAYVVENGPTRTARRAILTWDHQKRFVLHVTVQNWYVKFVKGKAVHGSLDAQNTKLGWAARMFSKWMDSTMRVAPM